jgi:hypothetical protein
VGQRRRLMNHSQRGVRKINRQKNLFDIQHHAPATERYEDQLDPIRL